MRRGHAVYSGAIHESNRGISIDQRVLGGLSAIQNVRRLSLADDYFWIQKKTLQNCPAFIVDLNFAQYMR
jgi:hypothetical protein